MSCAAIERVVSLRFTISVLLTIVALTLQSCVPVPPIAPPDMSTVRKKPIRIAPKEMSSVLEGPITVDISKITYARPREERRIALLNKSKNFVFKYESKTIGSKYVSGNNIINYKFGDAIDAFAPLVWWKYFDVRDGENIPVIEMEIVDASGGGLMNLGGDEDEGADVGDAILTSRMKFALVCRFYDGSRHLIDEISSIQEFSGGFTMSKGNVDVQMFQTQTADPAKLLTAAFNEIVTKFFSSQKVIAALNSSSITTVARGDTRTIKVVKSDVDDIPAVKVKLDRNAVAIIIGIENYRQKLPAADFATHDAQTVTEYLSKVMGYPEESIITLLNDHATKSDMEKYFEKWLLNNVEKDGKVFVYFSGHGAPNAKTGDAYLVPYDGDPSFIAETGYSLKRMYDALGKLPAKEIIVALDSCFSGAGGRSVIARGARPLVMSLQDNTISKNMIVLSASSGEQISSTYDEKGHGLFTYFMLKGIKNEDVVGTDGSINMDDLFGYIKPQVERIARKQYNNEQTPQLLGAK